ncbi:MAG: beta-ureidopropionase, partial [bacterium]|nr:beta-ureidopropionase [bacterium]
FHTEQIENVETYRRMLTQIASEHGIYVAQSSLVGFEGGKGFVGASWVVNPFGKVIAHGCVNREALIIAPFDLDDIAIARAQLPLISDLRSTVADVALEFERLARSPAP